MKNRWLMGAAAAALTVAGAISSQAADLPTRKEAPAPIFVPPPFTWTGFYIGGNAGGIWGSGGNPSTSVFAPGFPFVATFWPQGNNNNQSGFIGGGQAGYNWQTGAFVLGVETDFDGSSLSRSRSIVGPAFADFVNPSTTDFFTANGKISLDWLGSTRGRVGFVATPDNRLMFYGTGGVAYGGGSANLNVYDSLHGLYWSSNNNSATRTGWTIGGGVEYAWTNNIIIGAEYLYFDLGSKHLDTYPNPVTTAFFGTQVYSSTKINFDGNVIRGRISYKF